MSVSQGYCLIAALPCKSDSIETIFNALLPFAPAERISILNQLTITSTAREELAQLLFASDKANGYLSLSPIPALSALNQEKCNRLKQQLGAYQIIKELGRGGMGTVYLAQRADGEYKKQVAIKIVESAVCNALTLRRFKAERQILADLEHPNIVRLFDAGTTNDGCPYVVMEYIQGASIECYCQKQALSIRERLRLFTKVCAAVEYIHRQQIVHCDLKPANILITAEGIPKLLDFGIAMRLGSALSHSAGQRPSAGCLPLMTPEYASPEQILGQMVTPATDIYSLGVIFVELLTGRRPTYVGAKDRIQFAQAMSDQTPSTLIKPILPSELQGELQTIMAAALGSYPENRYQSIDKLNEAIENYLAD